jgi:hypothetical protein
LEIRNISLKIQLCLILGELLNMIKHCILIIIIIAGVASYVIAQDSSFCLMSPPYQIIEIPAQGFKSIDDELFVDSCTTVADSMWMKHSAETFNLLVAADGPHGSGRYWNLSVAITDPGETKPRRGLCLNTTTIGWRTLLKFNKLPLLWLDDRDNNGQPEVIIWDSFPFHEEASLAEFGLIGWVYEVNYKGILSINWLLSRGLAAEIAHAYRQPVNAAGDKFQRLRDQIARQLERFASGKCNVRQPQTNE